MQDKSINLHHLVVYRSLLQDELIEIYRNLSLILRDETEYPEELKQEVFFQLYNLLIERAGRFNGNLWKNYIVSAILADENPFSLACEKAGQKISTSVTKLATHDLQILKQLYDFDLRKLAKETGIDDSFLIIEDYESGELEIDFFEKSYIEKHQKLLQSFDNGAGINEILSELIDCYYQLGCGKLARFAAFYWDEGLKGIDKPELVGFEDLVGYDYQKSVLISNTEAFLEGKKANNILLYGEKGTGKSSSVKAVLSRYASKGLRMIELNKKQLSEFREIVPTIKDRGQRFIIFIDDLSFEDFEIEYKYIKASIEGSLESKAANVLFYVTSNRRHLIKENWSDRNSANEEIHVYDSQQEKLSFADRFGITLTYQSPDQEHYLQIVEELVRKNGIDMPIEELRQAALQWERSHHGRSGRTAEQFVIDLMQ